MARRTLVINEALTTNGGDTSHQVLVSIIEGDNLIEIKSLDDAGVYLLLDKEEFQAIINLAKQYKLIN